MAQKKVKKWEKLKVAGNIQFFRCTCNLVEQDILNWAQLPKVAKYDPKLGPKIGQKLGKIKSHQQKPKNALCFLFQANLRKIEFFPKMEALKTGFAFFRVVDVI